MQHHERAIQAFVEGVTTDGSCDAVIVTGSVARGKERPDSDIDLYLLVGTNAFDTARREDRLSYVSFEGAGYEGGYFDVKLVTNEYLALAAQVGDEPVRASFEAARIAWTRQQGLEEQIRAIITLPDDAWTTRQASFVAQARLQAGYLSLIHI